MLFEYPTKPFWPFPDHLLEAFGASLWHEPRILFESYVQLLPHLLRVQENIVKNIQGKKTYTPISAAHASRRFQHPSWQAHPYFYACHQYYTVLSHWLMELASKAPMLETKRQELTFYIEQWLGALSPANFPATNPELFLRMLAEGTAPFEKGFQKLCHDWQATSPAEFFVNLTKPSCFTVGKNIAITPGKVVYRGDLFELIHYNPQTPDVHRIPLLIIPPWINKFYIFDLSVTNSFVRWLIENGVSTFIISWKNPEKSPHTFSFADYLHKGALEAIKQTCRLSGNKQINTAGYCLGGNLLACALSALKNTKQPAQQITKVASSTFLATIGDFKKLDTLGIFLRDPLWKGFKQQLQQNAYVKGETLGTLFAFLRAQEMVWPALIDRYFLGKEPMSMDFLYWNADTLPLSKVMYQDFIETIVHPNAFLSPSGLALQSSDTALTFHNLKTPSFVVATRNDHIAPWRACYALFDQLKGPKTFLLSSSGHIAGIINPPINKKYGYVLRTQQKKGLDADAWLHGAGAHKGSWWPQWLTWLQPFLEDKISVNDTQLAKAKSLADAPGLYVMEK